MPLYIDSPSSVVRPGVYFVEVTPPRVIRGVSNGYIGLAARFAWGPVGVGYLPESGDDLIRTFEPPGSPRNSSGYYAIMQRLGAPWFLCGVKGNGASQASDTEAGTGGSLVSTAKYAGVLGNNILRTLQAASNGDSSRRDLVFTLSDPVTGTTREVYPNLALGQVVDVSRSRLLSSVTFTGTMTAWPANGGANLTGGSDGAALTANDYDTALTQLDLEDNVRVVCVDDCGDSIRDAVNGDIATHVATLTNRVGYIQGSPTATWAQVKANKALYTSDRLCYFGNWVSVFDDAGVRQHSPLATFAATIRVNLDVHQSIAWRAPQARKYLQSIKGIDSSVPFSVKSTAIQDEATKLGIILSIPIGGGGFGLLHGRTCNTAPGYLYEVTRWYKDYLGLSIVPALDTYVNGPNSRDQNLDIKGVVDRFMESEKKQFRHVEDFSTDIDSVNSQSTLANGDFFLALDAKTPGVRERIFLLINAGETVAVR
jgi:hypothetical protein